ncbi:MAG: UDP-N-acetylmuramoyl-tripeptide--D-alanyl-D-alanine ligase [Oscillospiraceae bacterium]|jgi:UDP-N-acetylmuramoyl-tripeptide--D-alanyl-D-alanine ligase|nr:UDP-N-acetylmuramoyl-tripeptide--D-alanyl-D-alanine ligase [Oscillospiraceae bacterium]
MTVATGLLFALTAALTTAIASRVPLHLLQLESYQLPGYRRAAWDNALRAIIPGAICAAVNALLLGLIAWIIRLIAGAEGERIPLWADALCLIGTALLSVACALFVDRGVRRRPAKKPLVITPRVKRLVVMLAAVALAIACALIFAARLSAAALFLPLFAALIVPLAAALISPAEKRINRSFFLDAQKRLSNRSDLIKIGITGSYGKTSTKFFLATILSEKYKTLATPSSFNTPMGVTRVVREQLTDEHQVFIAEMGARHVGEIKELCELVRPKYGILTSVGPQHLETFFTLENITNTKYELVEALPEDGAAIFADDGGIVKSLYDKTEKPAKYLAASDAPGLGARAEDVETGPWGSRFRLILADGSRTKCETKLLGAHNIQNVLLACTMAAVLGMSAEQIAAGVAKIEPVEHRLQIIPSANGVTIIDDAFNSNPIGARAALDVLRTFPQRRVIVTPGLVELGDKQAELNKEYGKSMKGAADVAIIVGRTNSKPIYDGLIEAGFPEDSIRMAEDLDRAQSLLAELPIAAGDTVLFENDLPDNYKN